MRSTASVPNFVVCRILRYTSTPPRSVECHRATSRGGMNSTGAF